MAQVYVPRLIPRNADPTRRFLAYGKMTIPNLVKELNSRDENSLKKTLMSLSELFHKPEHLYEGMEVNVMEKLEDLLLYEDRSIKELVTDIYCTIASHAVGRDAMLAMNIPKKLMELIDDPELSVRYCLHDTYYRIVSASAKGIDQLLADEIVIKLVERLATEVKVIKILMLNTLYFCIRRNPMDALCCNTMEVLTNLLKNPENPSDLNINICRVIQMLSLPLKGKEEAVRAGTVQELLALLAFKDPPVRAEVAGALMSITINIAAKKMVNREGGQQIIQCLNDKDESVRLNIVQTIANCAEDHQGRSLYLVNAMATLKELELNTKGTEKGEFIAKAAKRAIKVINWRP